MHFRNILLVATGETASRALPNTCRHFVPDVLQAEITRLAQPAWAPKIRHGTLRGRGISQASAGFHFGMFPDRIQSARLVASS